MVNLSKIIEDFNNNKYHRTNHYISRFKERHINIYALSNSMDISLVDNNHKNGNNQIIIKKGNLKIHIVINIKAKKLITCFKSFVK